jgi:hypothetical protein
MGRFGGDNSKSNSRIGFWIMVWIVYLFMFIVILPPIMSCTGICDSIDPNSLLYLWWFIWTLGGGTITWMQMTFGVFAGLLIVGFLDSMEN